jgi:hypothetical protein
MCDEEMIDLQSSFHNKIMWCFRFYINNIAKHIEMVSRQMRSFFLDGQLIAYCNKINDATREDEKGNVVEYMSLSQMLLLLLQFIATLTTQISLLI